MIFALDFEHLNGIDYNWTVEIEQETIFPAVKCSYSLRYYEFNNDDDWRRREILNSICTHKIGNNSQKFRFIDTDNYRKWIFFLSFTK